jgi:hypothetical protein
VINYEGLPIYKAAMDLVVQLDQATLRFPKRHKYAVGARLVDTATDVVMWIARSQRRDVREQALDRLCGRLDELKLGVLWTKAARLTTQLVYSGYTMVVAIERPESHGAVKRRDVRYLIEPSSARTALARPCSPVVGATS